MCPINGNEAIINYIFDNDVEHLNGSASDNSEPSSIGTNSKHGGNDLKDIACGDLNWKVRPGNESACLTSANEPSRALQAETPSVISNDSTIEENTDECGASATRGSIDFVGPNLEFNH